MQAGAGVGQLTFVDEQASLGFAGSDGGGDAVELHGGGLDFWREEFEQQVGAGQGSRHGHALLAEVGGRERRARDQQRPVAVAEAGAAAEQPVAVAQVSVSVEADGGDVVGGAQGFLVQGFDVGEHVLEVQAVGVNALGGERVEHEGVVGVGAVREREFSRHASPW